jgi:hypothetical protein
MKMGLFADKNNQNYLPLPRSARIVPGMAKSAIRNGGQKKAPAKRGAYF